MSNDWYTYNVINSRIGNDFSFLSKVDQIINWEPLLDLINNIHIQDITKQGRKAYPKLVMLKAILIQSWYNLSDVELENCLKDRLSFIQFCNLSLNRPVPDHSTICRFRNKLCNANIHKKILETVNFQISSLGLNIKSGSVIDASLIQAHSRPNRKEYVEVEPSGDEAISEKLIMKKLVREESKDPDARWIKKGKKSVYGYKANIGVDTETGLVQNIISTPANVHDIKTIPGLLKLIKLPKSACISADKGYSSKSVRQLIREMQCKPLVMFKKFKNDLLQKVKIRFNKAVSTKRYIVEQTFGCLHAHYAFGRTKYVGLEKTDYYLTMKCVAFNLKRMLSLIL